MDEKKPLTNPASAPIPEVPSLSAPANLGSYNTHETLETTRWDKASLGFFGILLLSYFIPGLVVLSFPLIICFGALGFVKLLRPKSAENTATNLSKSSLNNFKKFTLTGISVSAAIITFLVLFFAAAADQNMKSG